MEDLISRRAAIDAVADSIQHVFVEYRDVAVRMLEKVPSAEPEIIHCKDCDGYLGDGRCVHDDDLWGDDDFCSRAERRADG